MRIWWKRTYRARETWSFEKLLKYLSWRHLCLGGHKDVDDSFKSLSATCLIPHNMDKEDVFHEKLDWKLLRSSIARSGKIWLLVCSERSLIALKLIAFSQFNIFIHINLTDFFTNIFTPIYFVKNILKYLLSIFPLSSTSRLLRL